MKESVHGRKRKLSCMIFPYYRKGEDYRLCVMVEEVRSLVFFSDYVTGFDGAVGW